jgi:hypothetical protein
MSLKKSLAVAALLAATVSSIATSPLEWSAEDTAEGEAVTVDAANPTKSLGVTVVANDSAVPDEGFESELYIHIDPRQTENDAVIEATLVQILDDGTEVELDARTLGTGDADSDGIDNEGISLSGEEAIATCPAEGCEVELRVDLELVEGEGLELDWSAFVRFTQVGEAEGPEDASVELTLDPEEAPQEW